ncbi:hypothetical protein [Bifidobacterium aerophilum]|uniref:Molecular chaperone n=1 Tax=Bifidobacterium aerophilum TaxID=1798155 RepID=A0A6N9Z5X4_9BIFI|nr:hypothetical protein [Bifidobacterium aerophilum]NEG89836.1 hypothetical protein [Bifidobacterium aerophilum]
MTLRLNPALDEQELYEFAVDTEHWAMLDQIADHPHAWPELSEWARLMAADPKQAAPPPEPSATKRRGLLYRAHPPLIDVKDQSDDDGVRPMSGGPASDDAEPDRHANDVDTDLTATIASFDRFDNEHSLSEGNMTDHDDADEDDAASSVPRVNARMLAMTAGAMLLVVLLVAGGVVVWHLQQARESARRQTVTAQAVSRCSAAADAAKAARKEYRAMLDDAVSLTDATKADSLADTTLLDDLSALVEASDSETAIEACPTDSAEKATANERINRKAAKEYRRMTSSLGKAMDDVEASKLDKIIATARKLLESSKGKVSDDSVRTTLRKAIDARDAAAIAKASKTVNDSIAAKTKADKEAEEKRRAEQEQKEQEKAAQSQPSTPSWTPSYTPSHSTPSTPSVPQQQTAPQQQSVPQQSKPSTPQQSTPKTDPGNDGSML